MAVWTNAIVVGVGAGICRIRATQHGLVPRGRHVAVVDHPVVGRQRDEDDRGEQDAGDRIEPAHRHRLVPVARPPRLEPRDRASGPRRRPRPDRRRAGRAASSTVTAVRPPTSRRGHRAARPACHPSEPMALQVELEADDLAVVGPVPGPRQVLQKSGGQPSWSGERELALDLGGTKPDPAGLHA